MTSDKFHHNRGITGRTPLSEYFCAALSYGLLFMPAAVCADSGGQVQDISGDKWYVGSGHSGNNVSIDTDSTASYAKAAGGYSSNIVNPGGNVRNNTLTLENGAKVKDYAYGGYAQTSGGIASASGNTLTLRGGSEVLLSVYGAFVDSYSGTALANLNYLNIENDSIVRAFAYTGSASSFDGTAVASGNIAVIGGTVPGNIYGGGAFSNKGTGSAASNKVIIAASGRVQHAYGGYAGSQYGSSKAEENSLTVGGIVSSAYGGYAYNGTKGTADSENNTLTISGSAANAYGGYATSREGTATVKGNSVIINEGGNAGLNAYGGRTDSSKGMAVATGNSLTVNSGAKVGSEAYGGFAEGSNGIAEATGNNVTISSGSATVNVYGGYARSTSKTATVRDNAVFIDKEGTAVQHAYGGRARSVEERAVVSGNSLTVSNGAKVSSESYGGLAQSTGGTASAVRNSLTISGGDVSEAKAFGGSAISDSGTALASGNSLTVSYGAKTGIEAYGGYTKSTTGTATASGNSLNLQGESVPEGKAYGGYALSTARTALASGNSLTIGSGAKAGSENYGGYAQSTEGTADASGNTLNIESGNSFEGTVYGGYALGKTGAKAEYNKVILRSTLKEATLANVALFGGYAAADSAELQQVRGNTLESWARGLSVKSIANFEHFSFILPDETRNGDIILKITGGEPTLFSRKADFKIALTPEATLTKGSKLSLINNEAGLNGPGGGVLEKGTDYDANLKATKGISLEYDFELSNDATNIYATLIDDAKINPKTKAVLEGCLGGLGVVNTGSDLAAGMGISQALSSTGTAGTAAAGIAVAPFAAIGGGTQRLITGSHVDINGVSALTGIAVSKNFETMRLTGGAFFEFGSARLKTHNSFSSGDVNGKGRSSYYGGGLLARLDLSDNALKGLYVEGSMRFGRISSDWHTDDMVDAVTLSRAEFDLSYHYCGAHLGLGYILKKNDSIAFDMYGKLLWSRINGKDTKIADDQYSFDAISSWRSRVGTRVDYALTGTVSLYAGAAWEHEFDGDAKAKVIAATISYDVPSPSTGGNSAVIDFGVLVKNSVPGLAMGLGVTGYLGDRRGVTGNLQIRYAF